MMYNKLFLVSSSNAHRYSSKERERPDGGAVSIPHFTMLWSQFASLENPLKKMDFDGKKRQFSSFHFLNLSETFLRRCEEPEMSIEIAGFHVVEDPQVTLSHLSDACLPDGVKNYISIAVNVQGSLTIVVI